MSASPKLRLTILCLVPVLLSCLVISLVVYQLADRHSAKESTNTAKAFTAYLAMTSAQYLVNKDLLGINVVLNQMHKDEMFDFASVYDVNDQLVAQAGARDPDALIVSKEVTFQDSTTGYVQAGFDTKPSKGLVTGLLATIIAVHVVLAGVLLGTIWLAGDFVAVWVFQAEPATADPVEPESDAQSEPAPIRSDQGALLVLKLNPQRLTPKYFDLMISAASVYGGKPLNIGDNQDDVVIEFTQEKSAYAAICTGILMRTLVERIGKPLQYGLGIHWSADLLANSDEQAIKHTTYLASISEQTILVSKLFAAASEEFNHFSVESYRSSLAPDGEVFEVVATNNQKLIDGQAEQLMTNA